MGRGDNGRCTGQFLQVVGIMCGGCGARGGEGGHAPRLLILLSYGRAYQSSSREILCVCFDVLLWALFVYDRISVYVCMYQNPLLFSGVALATDHVVTTNLV